MDARSVVWIQERELEEIRDYEQRLEMQKKIIEEERQRLLQEHAPKLIGFLPKVRFQLKSPEFGTKFLQ